mgnify:FL=1
MDKINIKELDWSKLRKCQNQGSLSTVYIQDDICIKILDKLYPSEKEQILDKFLAMNDIKIDGVVFPKDLIVQDGNLLGYTMDYFQDSTSLNDYFTTTRFVNCKDIFNAVMKASEILREIHKYDIKVQDLSFENILINNQGEVKYIDIDSCQYQNYESYFLSNILHKYMFDYRRQEFCNMTKNTDRLSFLLAFYNLMYLKELQNISDKKYNQLSNHISTLNNIKRLANHLKDKNKRIPSIPYMDDLINRDDDYTIKRNNCSLLIKRLARKI